MSNLSSISDLETHLGYWLRFVSNQVSAAFAQTVADKGVSVAEWVLMRELFDQEPQAPSSLAERMGMTRGAISKLSDKLQDKGLIAVWPDISDKRRQDLSLTVQGRALVPELAALADRNDAEFFGHLGEADRAAIKAAMIGIVRRRGLKTVPID